MCVIVFGRSWFLFRNGKGKSQKNPQIDIEEAELLCKDENPGKYNAIFERRAGKGQCFYQPYLGTREFSCFFRLVNPETEDLQPAIDESRNLGLMLYDMDFEQNLNNPDALFFRADMQHGVIIVPDKNSKEVLR